MERIKLKLPDTFSFSTILPIRITDLNYGGHVGNDRFLSLIHEARQQFLLFHNYSELDFEGTGLIMSDVGIEFKKELNYGDNIIISVAAGGFEKFGFDLFYKMEVEYNGKRILAGKAKTGMICFDYENRKMKSVPEAAIIQLHQ